MKQAKIQTSEVASLPQKADIHSVFENTQLATKPLIFQHQERQKQRYKLIPSIYRQQKNFEREDEFKK
ncbi:hypothetical protein, partial [Pseudoalteromonas undina]